MVLLHFLFWHDCHGMQYYITLRFVVHGVSMLGRNLVDKLTQYWQREIKLLMGKDPR